MKELLRDVHYRGATSFAVLGQVKMSEADVCLVFSDGVRTIDATAEFNPECQVFAIASAPDADRSSLERLTRGRGGAVLRLGPQSDREILARLRGSAPRIVGVYAEDGTPLQFAALEAGSRSWAAVGEAPASGGIAVRIAGLGSEIVERRYPLEAGASRFAGAGALWAADHVSQLSAEDNQRDALVALSRQYSVASPAMSFIVLESPGDYVQADVPPPSSYPKERFKEYLEIRTAVDQEKSSARTERLEKVITAWEEEKRWWNRAFDPARPKEQAVERAIPPMARARAAQVEAQSTTAFDAESMGVQDEAQAITAFGLSAIEVTGERAEGYAESGSRISVKIEPWDPGRPYLRALDAAAPDEFDRIFERQEAEHSELPAFYFDVAEWLYRKKHIAEAIEMLLSALEVPARDTETLSMVADRLLRYGEVDRAIWLDEYVLTLASDRPQPLRALALALEKRAAQGLPERAREDLRRAVELLNEIIVTPWEGDYDGIELVALMDVNPMLPRIRGLGDSDIPLDARLQALLDVDVRVVIEWNTAATDMDLWVDQPDAERAVYSNPETRIGGRLSNDMTLGFGPEEYLLRRAIPGVYTVRVNAFAADAINPNGATIVTAHLFQDFGRPTQQEQTIELELTRGDQGQSLVGKFTVASK